MKSLPADPLKGFSLEAFGLRLRRGEITSESATRAYLERGALLEPRVGAFVHVANDQALKQARAIDGLLASGTDLGPLMGVPIAVKDLLTVDGMPRPTCGSNVNISDLIEARRRVRPKAQARGMRDPRQDAHDRVRVRLGQRDPSHTVESHRPPGAPNARRIEQRFGRGARGRDVCVLHRF